jgi:5'-nucleotidase
LGNRHRAEPVIQAKDPRGRHVYWVGSAGVGQDAGPGTDFHAIAEGYASITPLQIDLTRHAALPGLERWLNLE